MFFTSYFGSERLQNINYKQLFMREVLSFKNHGKHRWSIAQQEKVKKKRKYGSKHFLFFKIQSTLCLKETSLK